MYTAVCNKNVDFISGIALHSFLQKIVFQEPENKFAVYMALIAILFETRIQL